MLSLRESLFVWQIPVVTWTGKANGIWECIRVRLEKVRWNGDPNCPHCGSERVARKADGDRLGR